MSYFIKQYRGFEKDFERLEDLMQLRILNVLERLRVNPFYNIKHLKDVKTGVYCARIGDYRLRFDIFPQEKEIFLYRVRHRREVYR